MDIVFQIIQISIRAELASRHLFDGQYLLAAFCSQYPQFGFAISRLAPNGFALF